MATGGPSDEKSKVDLTRFWAEQSVEIMAPMLRKTGKFHVVPKYEEEHQLTYEEEEARHTSSSIRATGTPKPFDDESKTYRVVRPPTPTPRLSAPRHPCPLSPIHEAFEPHFSTPEPLGDLQVIEISSPVFIWNKIICQGKYLSLLKVNGGHHYILRSVGCHHLCPIRHIVFIPLQSKRGIPCPSCYSQTGI